MKEKEPKKERKIGEYSIQTTSILGNHGYTLTPETLGTGTFSNVYAAFSKHLKTEVAVKIIPKVSAAQIFLTKFLPRELELMKGLMHANIVTFIEIIETNVKIYLILEKVKGPSLLLLIQARKRLTEENAANILYQICTGVSYCHDKGVAHRDLKAENILLDHQGNVKLIDFGFARSGLLSTKDHLVPKSTTFCGSYAYACPEILEGRAYIPFLADVWSLGVILYIMVHGKLPFEDKNVKKLLKVISTGVRFDPAIDISLSCIQGIQLMLSNEEVRPIISEILKIKFLQDRNFEETKVKSTADELTTKTNKKKEENVIF